MARQREYRVLLSQKERKIIKRLQRRASSSNRRIRYSIILEADEKRCGRARTYKEIASAAGTSVCTVISTLKTYCSEGLEKAVTPHRSERSNTARLKATGDAESKDHCDSMHCCACGPCQVDAVPSDAGNGSDP